MGWWIKVHVPSYILRFAFGIEYGKKERRGIGITDEVNWVAFFIGERLEVVCLWVWICG